MANKRLTTEEFIDKAKKVHGDKYDYSKVEYKKSVEKVIIVCKNHGEFEQTPHVHLRGSGCYQCSIEKQISLQTKTTKKFIQEAKVIHGNKYDYSKVKYKNCMDKVFIICSRHGQFKQRADAHLQGQGCLICSGKEKKDTYQFIKDAIVVHNNKYDYSKVEYISSNMKIIIICPDHGEFKQVPGKHLFGYGCSFCSKKNEGRVKDLLFQYFKDWDIIPNKKIWDEYKNYNHKRFCDFWMEKNGVKVMVEYDGEGHFMPVCFNGVSHKKALEKFKKRQKIDKMDKEFCEENNIVLHRIKYSENKNKSVIKLKEEIEPLCQ